MKIKFKFTNYPIKILQFLNTAEPKVFKKIQIHLNKIWKLRF